MPLNGICLVSRNAKRLRDFYQGVLRAESKGNDSVVRFETAGAVLSIFYESGTEEMAPGSMENYGHGGFTIEFEVENVDDEYGRLKGLNVPIVKAPTAQPWARRSVWFRDPDGNMVNFLSNLTPPDQQSAMPRCR